MFFLRLKSGHVVPCRKSIHTSFMYTLMSKPLSCHHDLAPAYFSRFIHQLSPMFQPQLFPISRGLASLKCWCDCPGCCINLLTIGVFITGMLDSLVQMLLELLSFPCLMKPLKCVTQQKQQQQNKPFHVYIFGLRSSVFLSCF